MSGLQGPQLPTVLINGAQLMIGSHVGLMLKTNQLNRKVRTISLAVSSGIMLVMGAVVLSIIPDRNPSYLKRNGSIKYGARWDGPDGDYRP